MKYLIDTNIISELAPKQKESRLDALIAWLDRVSDDLFLSAVTAFEIRDGIAKAVREGATRKAEALNAWWDAVQYLYGGRILPFDLEAATVAGPMRDRARATGHAPGFTDIAIAAIAKSRGLTLLTRNLKHFAPIYGAVIDPFASLPSEKQP